MAPGGDASGAVTDDYADATDGERPVVTGRLGNRQAQRFLQADTG